MEFNNNNSAITVIPMQEAPKIHISSSIETSFSETTSTVLAVKTVNVCLSYRKHQNVNYVLNGVNMNVPKAAIYGLLGPSGCGKTSLLTIIIGMKKMELGQVSIFGFRPGTKQSGVPGAGVGYMPQDIALQSDLTVEEMLWYFGRLYCLDEEYLTEQIDFLVDLLQIPDKKRLILNLSGGQQRRVSLACTVIHRPRLLILDEPTVGVDPLLCKKIWDFMVNMSKSEKMTIIITTHYIEECRKAQVVGFMRKGVLLAEDSPNTLMHRYQTETLEEVFYSLCFSQKERKSIVGFEEFQRKMSDADGVSYGAKEAYRPRVASKKMWYFLMIKTLIWKYLIQTTREPGATVLMFLCPPLALGSLCICIGNTPFDVPVAYVVAEQRPNFTQMMPISLPLLLETTTDLGDLTVKMLETATIENTNATNFETSSERTKEVDVDSDDGEAGEDDPDYEELEEYLYIPDLLYQTIDHKALALRNYSDLNKAIEDIKKGRIWGAIYLGANFSQSFEKRGLFQIESDEWVENKTIEEGNIYIYGDFSQKFLFTTVFFSLQQTLVKLNEKIAKARYIDLNRIKPPVEIGGFIYGEYTEGDYFGVRDFAVPGFTLCVVYSLSYGISMLSIISEIHDQMFSRNYAAGLSATQIVIAQIVARFVFLGSSAVIVLLSTIYVFGVPLKGSFILAFSLLLIQTLTGMTHGMLVGCLIPDLFACCFTTTGMFLFIFFVSGVFWAREALPYYLLWFSDSLPFTLPAECFRSILIRQNAPFDPLIWPGFVVSLSWFLVFTICSILTFRSTK